MQLTTKSKCICKINARFVFGKSISPHKYNLMTLSLNDHVIKLLGIGLSWAFDISLELKQNTLPLSWFAIYEYVTYTSAYIIHPSTYDKMSLAIYAFCLQMFIFRKIFIAIKGYSISFRLHKKKIQNIIRINTVK